LRELGRAIDGRLGWREAGLDSFAVPGHAQSIGRIIDIGSQSQTFLTALPRGRPGAVAAGYKLSILHPQPAAHGSLTNEGSVAPNDAGLRATDAADTERARNLEDEAAAGRQGKLIGGIFLATFLFIAVVVTLGSRPAQITLTSAALSVRAAGYSADIARSRIDSVRLTAQLVGLGSKLNGFQFGSAYAGLFAMRQFGKVRLFVNASRPPYVMIFSRDGVVIVNGDSSAATQRLFADLSEARTTAVTP